MTIRQPMHRSPRRLSRHMLCAALSCAAPALQAATFTWLGLGNTYDWNDNTGNWDSTSADPYPGLLSSHDDVILGAVSQRFMIQLYSIIAIDGITVQAPYTLNISGDLIVQQPVTGSGLTVNLTGGNMSFESSASAGSTTITLDQNSELDFFNNATAASAAIDNAGILTFRDNTTAPNANVLLSGGSLDVSMMVVPVTLGSLHDSAATPGTVKLGSTALTLQSAADQILRGSVSGTGSLTQAGTGKLTLSGNNSAFAGSLKVQAGALQVDGDFSAAPVSVDGGATLRGGGRTGALSLIDGTLVPGGGAGVTLRIASLACSDAQVTFDLDAGTRLVIDQALAVAQCPQMHIALVTAQSIASGQAFDVATLSAGTDYGHADFSVTPPAGLVALVSVRANHVIVTLLDPADEIFGDGFD